jgi:hypothetical protein
VTIIKQFYDDIKIKYKIKQSMLAQHRLLNEVLKREKYSQLKSNKEIDQLMFFI